MSGFHDITREMRAVCRVLNKSVGTECNKSYLAGKIAEWVGMLESQARPRSVQLRSNSEFDAFHEIWFQWAKQPNEVTCRILSFTDLADKTLEVVDRAGYKLVKKEEHP